MRLDFLDSIMHPFLSLTNLHPFAVEIALNGELRFALRNREQIDVNETEAIVRCDLTVRQHAIPSWRCGTDTER